MNGKIFDISVEVRAVSMIVAGLSNQLDNSMTDTLTTKSMQEALFGIQRYLERLADDLETEDEEGGA